MTPDDLSAAGTALYGPRWQCEMARALKVSDRTVRRWASGRCRIPDGVEGDIAWILLERRTVIAELLSRKFRLDADPR